MRSKAVDAGRQLTAPDYLPPADLDLQSDTQVTDPALVADRTFLIEMTHFAIERYRLIANPGEWTVFEQCRLFERPVIDVASELQILPVTARKRLQRATAAVKLELSRMIGALGDVDSV